MKVLKYLVFLVIGVLTWEAFAAPNAQLFMNPEMARMIFWHLPCAISCTLFFYAGAYFSLRMLMHRKLEWDVRASSANEIGMVLAVLTMITGMLFSKFQWGAYWNWDPRQTSFLFVLLIYGAYLVLRVAIQDPQVRAVSSAGYALIAVLPASFFIFIAPRLPEIMSKSLHPSNTVIEGNLKGIYGWVTWSLVLFITIFAAMVYKLAVRAGVLELKVTENYGNLETRGGDSALTGVVRPISVSDQGGSQS
jgi:heme exporter protein C